MRHLCNGLGDPLFRLEHVCVSITCSGPLGATRSGANEADRGRTRRQSRRGWLGRHAFACGVGCARRRLAAVARPRLRLHARAHRARQPALRSTSRPGRRATTRSTSATPTAAARRRRSASPTRISPRWQDADGQDAQGRHARRGAARGRLRHRLDGAAHGRRDRHLGRPARHGLHGQRRSDPAGLRRRGHQHHELPADPGAQRPLEAPQRRHALLQGEPAARGCRLAALDGRAQGARRTASAGRSTAGSTPTARTPPIVEAEKWYISSLAELPASTR